MANKEWKMPKWMEAYRDSFTNTGGNSVEELINWHGTAQSNIVIAILSSCAVAQVGLLGRLYDAGKLN